MQSLTFHQSNDNRIKRLAVGSGLLQNVRQQGDRLQLGLQERFGNNPNIGDIRGRGLFYGIEIVADRTNKTPFEPSLGLAGRIHKASMERGLCVYPGSGTADGLAGDHVLIAPPFIVDGAIIDTIVERLGDAVDAAIAGMN